MYNQYFILLITVVTKKVSMREIIQLLKKLILSAFTIALNFFQKERLLVKNYLFKI